MAEISGKLHYQAAAREDLPAVGDWVYLKTLPGEESRAIIHGILARKSKFSRNEAGKRNREQIVAANIDTVFLVTALSGDFNIRRLERYLTMAWESGASPVIILNKADLCSNIATIKVQVESIAYAVPIHIVSCLDGRGMCELEDYLEGNTTVAFLGSSGVGKSTLINRLLGKERQKTGDVRRNDQKGRHTTTHRELIIVPGRGIVIDTPGMRELQLWNAGESVDNTFADIEKLARKCKFNDCNHETEPGCAVKKAIEEGNLEYERLESYRKLQRELFYMELKETHSSDVLSRIKWKDRDRLKKQMKKR